MIDSRSLLVWYQLHTVHLYTVYGLVISLYNTCFPHHTLFVICRDCREGKFKKTLALPEPRANEASG